VSPHAENCRKDLAGLRRNFASERTPAKDDSEWGEQIIHIRTDERTCRPALYSGYGV
jgi:hypothetical protein